MNLIILLLAAASASAPPDWMAGCWSGQSGPMTFEEQWTKPASGNMLGMARTFKGGKLVFSEFMRIDSREGTLVYTPRIGTKQGPVEFKLKSMSDTQVVFENPTHDFPQRILYIRNVDGLHARIEGNSRPAQDFPMKSVACK